mgnify:CR=1 FL=1
MLRLLLPLLACLALALPAATARAQQVQRCTGSDGRAVYTDRRCDDIGAVSRLPAAAAAEGPRLFRSGCPRLLSQLVGEIGAAIQNRDINRLTSVYDWNGVSDATASRLLDRLENVVDRPLVDIAPVYADSDWPPSPEVLPPPPAENPEAAGPAAGPAAWMPSWDSGQDAVAASPGDVDDAAIAPAMPPAPSPPRPRPVALRVEQTLAGRATPIRTVFSLRRNYGCFWIAL